VRENENSLPPSHTVYEYFVDHKLRDWSLWETRLTNYKPPNETPFFRIMVPTVDTLRTKTVALALATAQTHGTCRAYQIRLTVYCPVWSTG
jgi:dynein heavy chain